MTVRETQNAQLTFAQIINIVSYKMRSFADDNVKYLCQHGQYSVNNDYKLQLLTDVFVSSRNDCIVWHRKDQVNICRINSHQLENSINMKVHVKTTTV